jgi:protein arginine N-methyltransferase 3
MKGLEFLDLIRLVNYIRSEAMMGNLKPDVSSKTQFEDEKYLKPVLEDDAVLFSLEDALGEDGESPVLSEVDELREQLNLLQAQFSAYREDVQKAMSSRTADGTKENQTTTEASSSKPNGTVLSQDPDYFNSYSYNSIHEIMIKDKIRTDAYRDFIYDNKSIFQDKVVLDVGCGTGILSMFCAKAGAKLVLGVDNSDIINKARENVFRNDLHDKVTCIRGKIEDVVLPVPHVDIIVSEWMGYCLLYESMLDSVIYARDKYLAPDGLMVPSHATLRIAPLADSDLVASHVDFWRDVYGFNMASMLEKIHDEALTRVVDAKELAAESAAFYELDLHTVSVKDLEFCQPFEMKWKNGFERLEGFIIWFDIFFMRLRSDILPKDLDVAVAQKKGIVAFSTGPHSQATHWQQGVLMIKDQQDVKADDVITGHVAYRKKEGQERSIDVDVDWRVSEAGTLHHQTWFLD